MANTKMNIDVDKELLAEFESVCKEKEIPMDFAVEVFMSTFVRKKDFPFKLTLSDRLQKSYEIYLK